MIGRVESIATIRGHVKNENLVKHMIAVGAIMRGLAARFGGDEDLWEAVGVLHDVDYEEVGQDWTRHGAVSAEIVKDLLPEDGLYAIRAHNPQTGTLPKSRMDWSLYAADGLSGLIIAQGLMMPDKKIASIKVSSLGKRMKDKSFAKGVNRENILKCSEMGIELDEFFRIGIDSMAKVAGELGL
ncbi:MAG: HDIG domain-containing protein [Candidatus Bathyarchaeota archaeon]|nr:HDIG domain-containing protein [Candidatus Bathyarchaeota archaeon]